MDTDNLSVDAYEAVINEAGKFHRDLMLHFGGLAGQSMTEEEFLITSENRIKNWLEEWRTEDVLHTIFAENSPGIAEFENILKKIRYNVIKVRRMPLEKRKFKRM